MALIAGPVLSLVREFDPILALSVPDLVLFLPDVSSIFGLGRNLRCALILVIVLPWS